MTRFVFFCQRFLLFILFLLITWSVRLRAPLSSFFFSVFIHFWTDGSTLWLPDSQFSIINMEVDQMEEH